MNGSLRYALVTAVPILVILVAGVVLNPKRNSWGPPESPRAQCEAFSATRLAALPAAEPEIYDQRKLDRLVREPQDTVTSVACAVVGLAIILASYQPASRALGVACVIYGLGGGIYHMTLLPEFSMIDIIGVYAVLYCLVLIGATANAEWLKRGIVRWIFAALIWALAVYSGIWRSNGGASGVSWFDSTDVFAVAVAAIGLFIYAARRATRDQKRYARMVGLFIGTAVISLAGLIGDRFGSFWAKPDGPVQGHAVWHVFGAIAVWAAYEALATTGFDHSTLRRKQFEA